jgi:hypothetical protein
LFLKFLGSKAKVTNFSIPDAGQLILNSAF